MPEFLQRQLQIGFNISRQLDREDDFIDAAQQCLSREDGWLGFYQRSMEDVDVASQSVGDSAELLRITHDELEFGHSLWARQYADAAKALECSLKKTFIASRPTGAWHTLWLGYCYDLLDDRDGAQELYERAHHAERNIPPFRMQAKVSARESFSTQVLAVPRHCSMALGRI